MRRSMLSTCLAVLGASCASELGTLQGEIHSLTKPLDTVVSKVSTT